ncbi:hypothetical protein BAC3_00348 [uncultured bacterium]|nr:hypothetical protein BAC3_00348 [uncultured bacterium]
MPIFVIIHSLLIASIIAFAAWCFYLSIQLDGWGALTHSILMGIALCISGVQVLIWWLKHKGFKVAKPLMLGELLIIGVFLTYLGIDAAELDQYAWLFLLTGVMSLLSALGVWRGQL